jgi:hypothetical protein
MDHRGEHPNTNQLPIIQRNSERNEKIDDNGNKNPGNKPREILIEIPLMQSGVKRNTNHSNTNQIKKSLFRQAKRVCHFIIRNDNPGNQ